MTVTKSPRMGLTRWSDDNDPWRRGDWDEDNAQLEASAVKFAGGTLAARPAPGDATAGTFYRRKETLDGKDYDQLYYCDGLTWRRLAAWDGGDAIPVDDVTVSTSNNVVTIAAGWSISYSFRRRNGVVHATLTITRTGAPISASATGNLTNIGVGTLTDSRFLPWVRAGLANNGTGPLVAVYVDTAGVIALAAVPPNYTISTGETLGVSSAYVAKT